MVAPPSHHFGVNCALPCCDPLLPQEVRGLVSWSNGIRSELDGFYNLWSTHQEVDSQEIASVRATLDRSSIRTPSERLCTVHISLIQATS